MAAITDRATLKAAVLDYMDRPDLAEAFDRFVPLVESHFNAMLRTREMERATEPSAPVAAVAVPVDFLEWISVEWTGPLRTARPAFAEADSPEVRFRHRPGGDPQYFTVRAGQVRMVPAKPGSIILTYYAKVPPLTDDAPSNWLLAAAPDAYLYAILAEAYLFQKDPAAAQAHTALLMAALGGLGMKADTGKVAKRPSRSAEVEAAAQAVRRPE